MSQSEVEEQLKNARDRINYDIKVHQPNTDRFQVFISKLKEEIAELEKAVSEKDLDKIKNELGDVLFCADSVANSLHYRRDEVLVLQAFKHMYREKNSYNYVKKKYPADADLKGTEELVIKMAEKAYDVQVSKSILAAFNTAVSIVPILKKK